MAVSVELRGDADPRIGDPRVLVLATELRGYLPARGFDVSADGSRLLLIRPLLSAEREPLTLIENWLGDLKD